MAMAVWLGTKGNHRETCGLEVPGTWVSKAGVIGEDNARPIAENIIG